MLVEQKKQSIRCHEQQRRYRKINLENKSGPYASDPAQNDDVREAPHMYPNPQQVAAMGINETSETKTVEVDHFEDVRIYRVVAVSPYANS